MNQAENREETASRGEDNSLREANVLLTQEDVVDGLTATRLAQTFKALSDPSRVRIISALSHRELCVGDLAAALGMTQSAISHQLRMLREMRLVNFRKEGRHVYYRLDDEHIHDLFHQGLDHVRHG